MTRLGYQDIGMNSTPSLQFYTEHHKKQRGQVYIEQSDSATMLCCDKQSLFIKPKKSRRF